MAAVAARQVDPQRAQFNDAFDRRIAEAPTQYEKTTIKISRYIWKHCDLPNLQNPRRTKAKAFAISAVARAGAFIHTLATCGFQCREPAAEPKKPGVNTGIASTES